MNEIWTSWCLQCVSINSQTCGNKQGVTNSITIIGGIRSIIVVLVGCILWVSISMNFPTSCILLWYSQHHRTFVSFLRSLSSDLISFFSAIQMFRPCPSCWVYLGIHRSSPKLCTQFVFVIFSYGYVATYFTHVLQDYFSRIRAIPGGSKATLLKMGK